MDGTQTLIIALFFMSSGHFVHGYKILYLLPCSVKSHKNIFDALIIELAKRDHKVTVVSPYAFSKPVKNVQEIVIDAAIKRDDPKAEEEFFGAISNHPLLNIKFMKTFSTACCAIYLQNVRVKKLLESGKQFDVVILNAFLNDCALATAPILSDNIMIHSPEILPVWSKAFVPQPLSYIPHPFLPYTSKMNFFQRYNNVITYLGFKVYYNYIVVPAVEDEIAKYLPEKPSLTKAYHLVSFYLLNVDPVLTIPRPTMPYIVNVGGMHCKNANSLPTKLEQFVQISKNDGFIYFCLGANMQSKFLPCEIKKSFLGAFSKLKQQVIWKYEEELSDVPENVKIIKKAPQQDILGHPKIRAFITHGGLVSSQEAVYHAVPVVAIPLLRDQHSIVARIEELGIGVKVNFYNISEDVILGAIKQVLTPEYKTNMRRYSNIFRDQYQHPIQRAAFWVEYIIQHSGAKHLKSYGEDLNFFQYFLLDVIIFILVVFVSALASVTFLLKFTYRKICFFKEKNSPELKQKKKH